MFAIAVWDRETRVLSLIRDRMGEKPLYFGWQGERGRTAPSCSARNWPPCAGIPPSRAGSTGRLVQLMRHGYVGEELTIHEGLSRVQPGEMVEISHWAARRRAEHRYWDGRGHRRTTPRRT
jgi:asparagine synthase (glutamine-hydrolysing)